MSAQSWNIAVDGVAYAVVVDDDPASGKTIVRVNGRLAARPMTADETSRDVLVGSTKYQLTRSPRGGFDFDVAPTVFGDPMPQKKTYGGGTYSGTAARVPARTPDAPKKRSFSITGIVIGLVILGVIGIGKSVLESVLVPWKTWISPDNMFRVDFPQDPTRTGNVLQGSRKNHHFFLEYADLPAMPREVDGGQADAFMREMFKSWKQKKNADVSELKSAWVAGADGLRFKARVPATDKHPAGDVKGALALYKNRVFAVYAVFPPDDKFLFDVDRFINSFRLPDH